jgi:hypothetical protein
MKKSKDFWQKRLLRSQRPCQRSAVNGQQPMEASFLLAPFYETEDFFKKRTRSHRENGFFPAAADC